MSSQIEFIRPELLNGQGIYSWFTLRNHKSVNRNNRIPGLNLGLNTSEPKEVIANNRKLLLNELELKEDRLAYAKQIHETHVETVSSGGEYPDTDGLVTNTKDLVLAIQVADCAAILLGDSKNRVIGAAHAGWRGAADNICTYIIDSMKQLGAETENLKAFISPCISLKNFEVGKEVAEKFPSQYVDYSSYKKPHVNLNSFIRDQLIKQGIFGHNIELYDTCTIDNENFYSYRRQKDSSGRMMAMIKLGNKP